MKALLVLTLFTLASMSKGFLSAEDTGRVLRLKGKTEKITAFEVVVPKEIPLLKFGAEELRTYLGKVTASEVPTSLMPTVMRHGATGGISRQMPIIYSAEVFRAATSTLFSDFCIVSDGMPPYEDSRKGEKFPDSAWNTPDTGAPVQPERQTETEWKQTVLKYQSGDPS